MTEIKQDKINKVLNRKINLLRKEDTIEVVILENYLHSAMHTFSMSVSCSPYSSQEWKLVSYNDSISG